jgi:hypothetical protein
MSFILRVFNIAIGLLITAGLVSCGGGGSTKGSKTIITVIPKKPIVITGPTKDSSGNDVPGAWYRFQVGIDNPTDEEVTIIAVDVETTSISDTGTTTVTKTTFTPSQFNFQLSDTVQCEFTSFGTFAAASTGGVFWLNGTGDFTTGCDRYPVFIVGSQGTGPSGKIFRYKVVMKPQGWFGPENLLTGNPSFDRYEKQVTFFTQ